MDDCSVRTFIARHVEEVGVRVGSIVVGWVGSSMRMDLFAL